MAQEKARLLLYINGVSGGRMIRLTPAQTQAAKARVMPAKPDGFSYWTKDGVAPVLPTRREAEDASIEEWRANLEPA